MLLRFLIKSLACIAAICVAPYFACPSAQAQTYPNQPIRLLVKVAPGGGMESAVRHVVQKVSESGWPQIIVENRVGGDGTVAALATRAAAPDGYTMMQIALSTHAVNVWFLPDLKYDPVQDFSPITVLFSYPSVPAVPAGSPVKSLGSDIVRLGKVLKDAGVNSGPH
jgi:tripartite-type tricarboxylate transporter receptor subunit TctC